MSTVPPTTVKSPCNPWCFDHQIDVHDDEHPEGWCESQRHEVGTVDVWLGNGTLTGAPMVVVDNVEMTPELAQQLADTLHDLAEAAMQAEGE